MDDYSDVDDSNSGLANISSNSSDDDDLVDVETVGDNDEPISMVVASSALRNKQRSAAMATSNSRVLLATASDSGANKPATTSNNNKICCSVCGMGFRFPSKLRRHEKIHQPESEFPKEFPCDSCSKAFRYAYHLRRHKWLIHAPERPIFTCDVCFKSYKGEELFRLHRAMAHLSTGNYNTVEVNKPSTSSDQVVNTVQETMMVKNEQTVEQQNVGDNNNNNNKQSAYNCHVCGTNFKQKHYLTQHLMTHSKERPFICEVCHKGFARASTLFAHRYVHTVGRQFQCETCKKAFKHKRSLTEHIKSKICFIGETANSSNNNNCFNNRLSTCSSASADSTGQHPGGSGGQYVCEFCGAFFASVSYLYMHRRRCHRENLRGNNKNSAPASISSKFTATPTSNIPEVPEEISPPPAAIFSAGRFFPKFGPTL